MKEPQMGAAELQARLAAIVDSSDDAIVAKDLNGIIHSWNRGAEQIFGYTADEVIGKHITIIIPEDLRREEDEIIRKIRAGDKITHYETTRRRKDGRLIDISLTVSAVKDPTGRVIGASKIARDITQEKAARRALADMNTILERRIRERTADLEKALRELDSFNSAVSHDLRTPLRAITGFIQLALQDGNVDKDARRRLEMALQSSREMARTIEALLRLSRIYQQQIVRGPVDITEVALQILGRLQNSQPDRTVKVEVEEGLSVRADPAMTALLLENLLSNAWKFSGKAAEPTVRVSRWRSPAGHPGFSIADNGVGFDATEAATLFKPFQRLRPGEFEGIGIGLATVHRIVSAHGGTIHAEGRPGQGATFYVDLGADGL